jgi:predicted RNA methylase
VTISALNSAGNVATSYMGTVTIASSDPQAQLPGATALVNGTATVQVILRTAGNQTITVSDSVHALNSGMASVTVSAAQLAQLSVSSVPASISAGTAFNITVNGVDGFNNVVASYTGTLHFTSSDPQAILPADTKLQNGTGSFSVTLKTAGGQTITVTDTANASLTVTGGIAVNPGNVTQIVVSAPSAVTTNLAFMVTVAAEDTYGNPTPSYTGTVKFASSDTKATLPGNSTLTNGTQAFSVTLVTLGPETVAATDTVTASLKGTSGTINVVTNAATHLSVTGPTSSLARQTIHLTVTALDAANNTSMAYAGTVHFTSSDAQAKLPADSTLTSGTGTFPVTLETTGTETVMATDTTKSSITGMASVTVTAPADLKITSSNPPNGTVGQRYNAHFVTICIGFPPHCFQAKVYGFPLAATGGVPPYLWSWAPAPGSSLPAGLNVADASNGNCQIRLSRPACIYGTPTEPGTFNVVLSLTDSGVPAAPAIMGSYTIIIAPPPPPVVNATPTPSPRGENLHYSFTFTAAGYPPFTWSESGALPTGLMLDSNTGTLSGTPTQTGTFPITVTATDQFNQKSPAVDFSIVITAHGFVATGTMVTARRFHTATLLNNGKVLIAGGEDNASNAFSSAELYDPNTGLFTATAGNMTVARAGHTATLLGNGKVLITGGTSGGNSEAAVSSAELYDPTTDMFTATAGSMTAARASHTATLLQSGKVLIAGGDVIFFNGVQNTGIMSLNTAETFDPSTGMFTKTTGNMTVARESHTATLLSSGKVLLAGGSDGALGNNTPAVTIYASADLFDPTTGQFTAATGMLTTERDFLTANLLGSGKVLLAGGVNASMTLGTADLFDPSSQSFTATGNLVTPRFYHDATPLNDTAGTILVTGGITAGGNTDAAETYDPTAGTFTVTGSMLHPRVWHSSTVLPNGKILVTGGEDNTSTLVSVAELYQ